MTLIWGMTPLASVFCRKISGIRPGLSTPSLNARAAAVVQADDGRAHLDRHIHNLDDLGCVRLAQAAAHHREILRIYVNQPPVNRAPAGDHAVA